MLGKLGFSTSRSKGRSTTNPWAKQSPWLEQGFERAGNILDNPYQGDWWAEQNAMQGTAMQQGFDQAQGGFGMGAQISGMGGGLMAGLPGAQEQFSAGMGNQFQNAFGSDQYNALRQDTWGAPQQAASDQAFANMMENVRRTDAQDAMGASLAGQSVGASGDRYLQARQNALGEGLRGHADFDAQLRLQGLESAEGRASQWAGSEIAGQQQQFMNRQGAASQIANLGMQGADMMQGGWGMGQQAAQAQLGYGDYQYGLDQDRVEGGLAQDQNRMASLLNAWNIWGGANWGGQTKSRNSSAGLNAGFG